MKRTFLPALLATCIAVAQDTPAPAPVAAPAQSEMQKWIATTDEQWQAVFKRDITDVHGAELNKLKLQYLTALEAGIIKASGAGDLNVAVALRNEQKRFGDTQVFPEQDDAADAASVKQLRAAIRIQIAKLAKDTAARTKVLHAKYDQVFAQAQAQLTQRERFDDALLVKAKRDEVAAAWLTPAVAAADVVKPVLSVPVTPPSTIVEKPVTPPKVPFGTKAGPVRAKVETEGAVLLPLTKGEKIFGAGSYVITEVSASLEGYQFTQTPKHMPTLSFKVASDGIVQMACSSRFAPKRSTGWDSEVTTEQMLQQKGWHKERNVTFASSDPGYVWWVFTRQCKAGEQFSIRTEKYSSPILLLK